MIDKRFESTDAVMRRKLLVSFLLFILLFTCSCSAKKPTGYPTGELQRTFLYHEGTVYVSMGLVAKEGAGDIHQIGNVRKIDNISMPDEEMEASHLEVGQKVWQGDSAELLFVEAKEGKYERMVPYQD